MPQAELTVSIPEDVWIGAVTRSYPETKVRVLSAMAAIGRTGSFRPGSRTGERVRVKGRALRASDSDPKDRPRSGRSRFVVERVESPNSRGDGVQRRRPPGAFASATDRCADGRYALSRMASSGRSRSLENDGRP